MEITLALPDELLARVGAVAQRSGRRVEDVLSETISLSFAGRECLDNRAWNERSDEEVLAGCEIELDAGEDRELSVLLARQNAGTLSDGDRNRLQALMRKYEDGLLLKGEAIREAVKRGLKEPLSS